MQKNFSSVRLAQSVERETLNLNTVVRAHMPGVCFSNNFFWLLLFRCALIKVFILLFFFHFTFDSRQGFCFSFVSVFRMSIFLYHTSLLNILFGLSFFFFFFFQRLQQIIVFVCVCVCVRVFSLIDCKQSDFYDVYM